MRIESCYWQADPHHATESQWVGGQPKRENRLCESGMDVSLEARWF